MVREPPQPGASIVPRHILRDIWSSPHSKGVRTPSARGSRPTGLDLAIVRERECWFERIPLTTARRPDGTHPHGADSPAILNQRRRGYFRSPPRAYPHGTSAGTDPAERSHGSDFP